MQVQGSEGVDHQLKKLKQGMRLSGVYVVSRRVPITRKASERLCEIDEEGTFMAQCGRCYHKARMIIALQNGENEGFEVSEAEMLDEEDKHAHCIGVEEIGGK